MPDGKCCNQDQDPSPRLRPVDSAKRNDKQDMIISFDIGDMLDAELEVGSEFGLHNDFKYFVERYSSIGLTQIDLFKNIHPFLDDFF